MKALLYRPHKKHYAYRWGVYMQLPNGKKWLVHYDNVVRGDGINVEMFREMKNAILNGEIVKVEAEWMVKVLKVLDIEEKLAVKQ